MQRYAKNVYSLTVGNWTTIVAPIDCNDFWIRNRDGLATLETTDLVPGPSSPYDIIPSNILQNLPTYVRIGGDSSTRFKAGDTITNLAASVTPSVCVVTFVV